MSYKPYDPRTLRYVVKRLSSSTMREAYFIKLWVADFVQEAKDIEAEARANKKCSCGGKKGGFTCAENCSSKSRATNTPVKQLHVLQVTDSAGNWKDFSPGYPAGTDLAQTIEIAEDLKPDGRRMRVVTFTQTAVHEVKLPTTREYLASNKNKRNKRK